MSAVILFTVLLTACVEGEKECLFCGEFSLLNLTKSDFKNDKNNPISIRRTLNINEFSGYDYYTIWLWNEYQPESSWSEQLEKQIQIKKNQFKLNKDGTWLWSITTLEKHNASESIGDQLEETENNHTEYGSWTFIDEYNRFIELTRVGLTKNDNSHVKDSINISRPFEISFDKTLRTITMKSIHKNNSDEFSEQKTISYSLLEGDIFLKVKAISNLRMAAKMK